MLRTLSRFGAIFRRPLKGPGVVSVRVSGDDVGAMCDPIAPIVVAAATWVGGIMPLYTILSVNPVQGPIEIDAIDPVAALTAIGNERFGVVDLLEDGHYVLSCDATLQSEWKIFRRRWL
jgi:hypothetical protein